MTEHEHPSVSWQAMQDGTTFYRRQHVYSMPGKLPDLSDYIVAGCRWGGPIAIMRNTGKLVALGRSTPYKSQIQVYSSSGEGLLLFNWDDSKIIKFGWTYDERLVVLNEEGVYRIYDLQGEYEQFSLGSEAGETGIIDARIHESGLVAFTGALMFLEVKGWLGGKPLVLANPNLAQPPHSWAVIPPDLTISRHVEILMSVDASIFSVDNLECVDQRLSRGPFSHISPSPKGKWLALLLLSGVLWVVSADFQRNMAEFDTKTVPGTSGGVVQVEWCGNDAILVTFEGSAVLVGPFGDTQQFFYTSQPFAVTEIDGVRIVSSDVCEFVQKVPTSSLSIFKPGSTSASAILYDAWDNFSMRSPKADDSIRNIKADLAVAVDECIDAAGQEWEAYWQKRLLNTAKFGRAFLDRINPTSFVAMGQTLKVLNAVHHYEIGIPLTYTQYIDTSPDHLISRLTSRNLHLLALRISEYLGLKPDPVLKHWAAAKITRVKPSASGSGKGAEMTGDVEVCRLIVEKFDKIGQGAVSYADIAEKAWKAGRSGLATKLLDHEARASDQVPLLLTMQEDKLALEKAVDSGDTDLVYQVLLHLHKRMPLGDFFRLIEDGGPRLAPAARLLEVYAREQNLEMLRDFYYSDDRRVESAVLCLNEAAKMADPAAKLDSIKAAQKFFSEDRNSGFESKVTNEYAKLLTYQQQLEKEEDGRIKFIGLSVNETIRACLTNGLLRKAETVRKDFSVPDKRFWYIKLQALTELRDFEGLTEFAKSRRSPIGYEPFVRHLVDKGHPKQAIPYVARCDGPKRVDLYVKCGEWQMAGQECKTRNDKAKMEELRQRCPNNLVARELEAIAATMK